MRFRSQSYIATPPTVVTPLPVTWANQTLHMEIKAFNLTHYSFSAGPVGAMSEMRQFGLAPGAIVSWGFTGTLVGVYATTNGGAQVGTPAYFGEWMYHGQGQYIN